MDSDMKRQRMLNAPPKLFDPAGNSSLGSLPRGEVHVRRDTITITSTNQANDFKIGSGERTKEIPRSILETGMKKFTERNDPQASRREDVRFDVTARSASLTPNAVAGDGFTPGQVNATAEPQTRSPAADTAFASGDGLLNPTNRIV
jgi:hypothetical protein